MRQGVHTACQPCCCACYSHKSPHCVGAFNKPWYLRDCFQWGTNSLQVSTNILSSVYSYNFNFYLCIQVTQQESQHAWKIAELCLGDVSIWMFLWVLCVYMWEWESSEERSAQGLISADDNKSQLAQTESCSHSTPRGLDICVVRCMYTQITQSLATRKWLKWHKYCMFYWYVGKTALHVQRMLKVLLKRVWSQDFLVLDVLWRQEGQLLP